MDLTDLLTRLTTEQKHELDALGIPKARRSDWKNGRRLPTVAQLKTVCLILDENPTPWLHWLAQQEATPQQLDLFLKALAKSTAAVALVILSGAGNHADAASMRVPELTTDCVGNAHYARLLAWLRRRCRRLVANLKAPSWGLFFAWSATDNTPC
jgi:hypothetical protein